MIIYTKQEAADLLRVSPKTIKRLCDQRLLPFHFVGSRKRFTDEDIKSYLDRHSIASHEGLSA